MIFRILFVLFDFPYFMEGPFDADFYILRDHMEGGLYHFYDENKARAAIYLYYWYFLFFPFYIIPPQISIYLWDIFRLITYLYVINKVQKISKDDFVVYSFILLSYIGFFFDAYLGNSNFLILFFLFQSYLYLDTNKIWLSGIFFALSCFKITSFLFLLLWVILRKLKLRDIPRYITPFLLFLIPYIIFPNLFFQYINNLFILEGLKGELVKLPDLGNPILNFLAEIYLFIWQAVQPAQIMVYAFFLFFIMKYIMERKKIKQSQSK
ncbi:MAG: conserved membrane protein of unknown function [Promethearchaeota archaeon]|nr:MAG: conserved membrane protein of unknown function [Candidatus Lokiarchaeota archaeon]